VQAERKSLVLGVYRGHQDGEFELTPTAEYFDSSVNGKLRNLVKTYEIDTNFKRSIIRRQKRLD
jgi:hypothetical protein